MSGKQFLCDLHRSQRTSLGSVVTALRKTQAVLCSSTVLFASVAPSGENERRCAPSYTRQITVCIAVLCGWANRRRCRRPDTHAQRRQALDIAHDCCELIVTMIPGLRSGVGHTVSQDRNIQREVIRDSHVPFKACACIGPREFSRFTPRCGDREVIAAVWTEESFPLPSDDRVWVPASRLFESNDWTNVSVGVAKLLSGWMRKAYQVLGHSSQT